MGGEWNFSFKTSNKDSFDLKLYQELLTRLKSEFQPSWKLIKPRFPISEDVYWCPRGEIPPRDNIFARFTFKCQQEDVYKPKPNLRHPSDCIPVWNIYWNPLIAHETCCGISARCADTNRCIEVQKRLDAFPDHFDIELGDGLMGFDSYQGYTPGRGLVSKLCPNYNSDLQGKPCKCSYCKDDDAELLEELANSKPYRSKKETARYLKRYLPPKKF